MKKTIGFLLLGTLFAAALALAQENPPPATLGAPAQAPTKVGILNTQLAIVSTAEGKKAAEELQTQYAPKRNELEKKQREIQELQDQLRKQERTLSPEAAADLRRQIESKTKELNREAEDVQDEFQKKEAELVNRIGQKMLRVVDRYAQDNSYAVILDVGSPQSPVLYASNTVDVTADIVRLYDVTYKIETPAAQQPSARPPARQTQPPQQPSPAEAKKPAAPPPKP